MICLKLLLQLCFCFRALATCPPQSLAGCWQCPSTSIGCVCMISFYPLFPLLDLQPPTCFLRSSAYSVLARPSHSPSFPFSSFPFSPPFLSDLRPFVNPRLFADRLFVGPRPFLFLCFNRSQCRMLAAFCTASDGVTRMGTLTNSKHVVSLTTTAFLPLPPPHRTWSALMLKRMGASKHAASWGNRCVTVSFGLFRPELGIDGTANRYRSPGNGPSLPPNRQCFECGNSLNTVAI